MERHLSALIKVDAQAKSGDFNGPFSSLSVDDQVDYLSKYYSAFSKEYDFDAGRVIVDDSQIRSLLDKLPKEQFTFRQRKNINDFDVSYVNKNVYRRLRLYTDDVSIHERVIHFGNKVAAPLPSVELENEKPLSVVDLSFSIGDSYHCTMQGGVDTMVPGKTIEFKNGVSEILKIGIYPNGAVYVRLLEKDPYHHVNIFIGNYGYDVMNSLRVVFGESIEVVLNGVSRFVKNIQGNYPDSFFVGSGLHGGFDWKIAFNEVVDTEGEVINPFEKRESTARSFNRQSVPSAFGLFEHRGETIVLRSSFAMKHGKKAMINIDDIGPGARIFINDSLVARITSPSPIHLNVGEYVHPGENRIQIELDPQAPENYVPWHRHKDPFFGSFIGNVSIDQIGESYIESVFVKTMKADPVVAFGVEVITKGEGKAFIDVMDLNGNVLVEKAPISDVISFSGTPWSPTHPVLYRVVCSLEKDGVVLDQYETITGFRVLEQKNGKILCNELPIVLKGALVMQYLPPYRDIPLNHVCPSDEQIAWQCLLAKKMNANCLRMHQLGYGSNDPRFARICDYLGIALIWITRYIDSVYGIVYDGTWHQADLYKKQMEEVINAPSIWCWEGGNEMYLTRREEDAIYREFVSQIKKMDSTRLLSPVSHLYYGNDSYDRGCEYYQDNGKIDEYFKPCESCEEWNDSLVIRSAHTYDWLLGYGNTWDKMREQNWSGQPCLIESKNHAYIVTEYAVIGRQCPSIPEANEFFNNASYEVGDENRLGYCFGDDRWELSQAYQALAANVTTRKMLSDGVDGMLWCSLTGGANDGSYFKPIIDFYGHAKLAYYALKSCFSERMAFLSETDVVWHEGSEFGVTILTDDRSCLSFDACVEIENDAGEIVEKALFADIKLNDGKGVSTMAKVPKLQDGFYKIYISFSRRSNL